MRQAELVFAPPPFVAGSDTSEAAAIAAEPMAGTWRWYVLNSLRALGPATDEEIQERLSLSASTERPRRIELYRAGLVVDTGFRRLTKAGRETVVWGAAGGFSRTKTEGE